MTHTSGPWYQGQSPNMRDNHPQQRSIALSLEPDGTPFGYRLGVDNDDGAYLNMSGFCSEADARLIAAAPDLLEAAKLAVWIMEALPHDVDTQHVDEIRAAIAKATGA